MKKRKNLLAVLMLLGVLMYSCSPITVTSDYDKTVDFSKYSSYEFYGWTNESDKLLNQLDQERLEQSFAKEFDKRNLAYKKDNGELVVSMYVVVDQKTSTTAYTNHYGSGPYGGYGYGYNAGWGWGGGYSTTTYSEHDYLVGTLVIDVFDKATKSLIWQGVGSKTIDENPKSREKNSEKVASAVMKDFPIKPVESGR